MSKDPFSSFDPVNGKPVTIVFGSFNYRRIVHKWIKHAAPLCDHWRIICLDREIISWLNKIGYGTCAVYLYDVLPDARQYTLTSPSGKLLPRMIFLLRQKLFRAIIESGRDFIHSDADAFWQQDPLPWLMHHTEFDILISQGTFSPRTHHEHHHFVLCAGFFFCRANERTQNYFRRVEEIGSKIDQVAMNKVLLNDSEAYWKIHKPAIWWSTTGRLYGPWRKIPMPICTVLRWVCRIAPRLSRRIREKLLQLHSIRGLKQLRTMLEHYIYISPEIIKGSFSNGLTLGVIPMYLITRIEDIPSTHSLVVHTIANKKL